MRLWHPAVLCALAVAGAAAASDTALVVGAPAARAVIELGAMPLRFLAGCGPRKAHSTFHARGLGYRIELAADGARVGVLRDAEARSPGRPTAVDVARIRFVGADGGAVGSGVEALPGETHYLREPEGAAECTGLPSYGRVRFAGIYPGIDVVFYGTGGELEFDFVIAPGADPAAIRVAIENADLTTLNNDGDLAVEIGGERLLLRRPVAYQENGPARDYVATRFVRTAHNEARLQVGAWDPARALTIDPVLSYATWIGGTRTDYATAVAVDAAGNAYVAGYTASADFPLLAAYDKTLGANDVDAFVTKIASTGKAVVYSTFLGGAGIDRAVGIAVDAAGNAYVTGTTTGGFPTTSGAYQAAVAGSASFVAKLAPAGNALVYSTYLDGVEARGIAVDAAGSAYVAGRVTTTLATTPGAYQRTAAGAFVVKLNAAGTAASYATYLGGGGVESANAIAVDAQGSAYVVGGTESSALPTANALQPGKGGGRDGFIAKLQPGGGAISYASYLGGALDDTINAVAVDADGNAYVAGETYSSDFPVVGGYLARKPGDQVANSVSGSAFYAKLTAGGDSLVYSSFLGGEICASACTLANPAAQTPGDAAYGIAVDAQGHLHVSGLARSYTFPLQNSARAAKTKDAQDSAFVTKVARNGGTLLYSTLVRTGTAEAANGATNFPPGSAAALAVDAAGAAYVAGDADSLADFKPTTGAFQTTNGGGQGALALKLAAPAGTLALTASATAAVAPAAVTLTATLAGATVSGNVLFVDGPVALGSAAVKSGKAALTTVLGVGIHRLSAVYQGAGNEIDSASVSVVVDNALACVAAP